MVPNMGKSPKLPWFPGGVELGGGSSSWSPDLRCHVLLREPWTFLFSLTWNIQSLASGMVPRSAGGPSGLDPACQGGTARPSCGTASWFAAALGRWTQCSQIRGDKNHQKPNCRNSAKPWLKKNKIPHLNGGGLTDLEEFVQIFTLHQGTQLQGALPRAILLLLPRHGSSHPWPMKVAGPRAQVAASKSLKGKGLHLHSQHPLAAKSHFQKIIK